MNETGIIMSGDHPKLILEGIKTQTRRVIKPQPFIVIDGAPLIIREAKPDEFPIQRDEVRCPYGQVGDRLWVRETFGEPFGKGFGIIYRADYGENLHTWKPSIHMFRKDSRINLEITDIRVERLQEITWKDVEKEGVSVKTKHAIDFDSGMRMPQANYHQWLRVGFLELWDSLNAKRGFGWEVNPWVWVISFKKVEDETVRVKETNTTQG